MGRKIDIGSYFDELTKGARGGRRTTSGQTTGGGGADDTAPEPPPATPAPSGSGGSGGSGGSLKDRLRDILVGRTGRSQRVPVPAPAPAPAPAPSQPRRSRDELPAGATVQIEYSPRMDGDPDPGDVVWAWVPFEEDPTQGKDRPLVVIGRRGNTLVGVPLTTKQNPNEAQLEVGSGDWDPQGRVGYARIWRMMDIDDQSMRREGAVLDRRRFDQLVKAVDEYYDVVYADSRSGGSSPQSAPDY